MLTDREALLEAGDRDTAWHSACFTRFELADTTAADAAAQSALVHSGLHAAAIATPAAAGGSDAAAALSFARALERLAAALARARAHKPPIAIAKRAFLDGAPKPDCVEVVVREVFELLLFRGDDEFDDDEPRSDETRTKPSPASGSRGWFDATRFPPTADARVVAFFSHDDDRDDDDDDDDDAARGAEWFALCSELDGCEYLATTPPSPGGGGGGRRYELAPTLANVRAVLGALLLARDAPASDADAAAFAHAFARGDLEQLGPAWNSWRTAAVARARRRPPLQLEVTTARSGAEGGATLWLQDEADREVARLRLLRPPSADASADGGGGEEVLAAIELRLERAHNIAAARHTAQRSSGASAATIGAHLDAFAHAAAQDDGDDPGGARACVAADEGASAVRRGVLALAVWPALLGDAMLHDPRALATALDRGDARHQGALSWWRRHIWRYGATTSECGLGAASGHDGEGTCCPRLLAIALLAARWGPERAAVLREAVAASDDGALTARRAKCDARVERNAATRARLAIAVLRNAARDHHSGLGSQVASELEVWLERECEFMERFLVARLAACGIGDDD